MLDLLAGHRQQPSKAVRPPAHGPSDSPEVQDAGLQPLTGILFWAGEWLHHFPCVFVTRSNAYPQRARLSTAFGANSRGPAKTQESPGHQRSLAFTLVYHHYMPSTSLQVIDHNHPRPCRRAPVLHLAAAIDRAAFYLQVVQVSDYSGVWFGTTDT